MVQAFILGKDFIGNDPVCLILGDNLFYGNGLVDVLKRAAQLREGGHLFAHQVTEPQHYGVLEFNETGEVVSIEEKPRIPKSNYAMPGMYFYDSQVLEIAATVKPSERNELEITDLNRIYLARGQLKVEILGRGYAWLDTGTYESLHQAASFIQTLEQRQGLKVACIEEIAYRQGYIDAEQLARLAKPLLKSSYGRYLIDMINSDLHHTLVQQNNQVVLGNGFIKPEPFKAEEIALYAKD